MLKSRSLMAAAIGAVVVLAAAGCASTTPAADQPERTTLNIGYFPVVSPVPIMQDQDLLADLGYDVNWVEITQGLPGAASALAAGQLDMTWGNSASATVIFSQSPDAAFFVGQSFVNANVTIVGADSGIKSIEDLAGEKVVVSGPKTASTLFFEIGLKSAGIEPGGNEYFVSGTGPGMVGVLESGDVDVAATYVPYAADMVLKGIGEILFTGSDVLGADAPGDGFIVSQSFAKKHPDAVVEVLRAQFAATDVIKDSPADAYELMADFAGVDVAAVEYSFDNGLVGVASSYVPDVDGLATVAELAQDLGFAPNETIDLTKFVTEFVNTEFAERALED
ncbi:ABC transporter substrate-binding protein [Microbacterium sp. A93]|uniref:ABC transporter substrate-binding protein n=1 Tax=unclassified Microbacterium TaxID=2609290 RepID=UPI003F433392